MRRQSDPGPFSCPLGCFSRAATTLSRTLQLPPKPSSQAQAVIGEGHQRALRTHRPHPRVTEGLKAPSLPAAAAGSSPFHPLLVRPF